MVKQQEDDAWEYVPGLLELVDEGLGVDDLGSHPFVAPQVRSTPVDPTALTPDERSRLERLFDWLQGYRREGSVATRVPVWVQVGEVWPPAAGKATFAYETTTERESQAELSVVAVGGFGGASRRTLTSAVQLNAEGDGVSYETLVHVSVYRYLHIGSGKQIHRVDVDAGGDAGEFRARDLAAVDHPAGAGPQQLDKLRTHYDVLHIERSAGHQSSTERKFGHQSLRNWHVNLGGESLLPSLPIKLAATCQRAQAFETTFILPGGHDYAFCAPQGESPVVPLCVILSDNDDA